MAYQNRAYTMPGNHGAQELELAGQLLIAVHDKTIESVRRLLDAGANPLLNVTGHAAGCPVDAAMIRFQPALELMIRRSDVLHSRDVRGATLMHRAAVMAGPSEILCLMNAGANLDAQDEEGATPLLRSIEAGGSGQFRQVGPATARNVRCLLALGAEPPDGLTLLFSDAMEHTHPLTRQDVKEALEQGPLYNAVRCMEPEIVRHVMVELNDGIERRDLRMAMERAFTTPADGVPEIRDLFGGFFQSVLARAAIDRIQARGASLAPQGSRP